MSKYPVDDLEKDPEESTETSPQEEKPASTEEKPAAEETKDDTDWKARALKAEEVAESYKKENQKYRGKKDRIVSEESKGLPADVKRDFFSKREDVIDEMREDINKLGDDEWEKIQDLFKPAVERVMNKAIQENRFVAKGEIKRAISDVIEFAKTSSTRSREVEEARAEGAREADKMERAEISGVKRSPSPEAYDEDVRKLAEEKGWDLDTAKTISQNRKERAREYAVRGNY